MPLHFYVNICVYFSSTSLLLAFFCLPFILLIWFSFYILTLIFPSFFFPTCCTFLCFCYFLFLFVKLIYYYFFFGVSLVNFSVHHTFDIRQPSTDFIFFLSFLHSSYFVSIIYQAISCHPFLSRSFALEMGIGFIMIMGSLNKYC